ncbi:hypothetical protein JL720_4783 [Aureococcus anophagefferens]|nr:hypothetical protein JL720_4783 [Aureococcus anophagefferens]
MDQGVLRNQCSNYNYDKVWVGAFVDILKKGLGPQDHRAAVRALNAEHREAHEEVEEERARAREEEREAKAERARAREEAKAEREAEKEAKDRAREEAKAEREAADQAEKDRVAAQVILGAMAVSGRSAASIFGEVDEGFAKLVDICDGILRTPRTLFYIYLTAVAEGEDADVAAFEEAKSAARRSTFLLPGVKFLEGNMRAIKVADVAWIARRLEAMGHGHYAALCRNRILWKRRSCGTVARTGCRYAVCVAWTQRRVGEPRPAGSYSDCLAGIPPLSAAVKRQLEAETIPRLPSVQGPSDITIVLRKTHERVTLCPYSASHYEIKTLGRVVFFIWWRRSPKKAAAARDAEYAALWTEAKREGGLTANLAAWFGGEANERRRAAKDAETPADARREALEARKCADKLAALAVEARDADAAIVHKFAAKAGRDADAAEVFAELPPAAAAEAEEAAPAAADPLAAQYRDDAPGAVEPAPRRRRATLAAIADASDEPAVVVEEAAGELVAIEGGDQDLDDFDSDDGAAPPPPPTSPRTSPRPRLLSDVAQNSTAGSDGLDATMSSTNEAAPGRLDAMFSAQNSTAGRAEGNALFVRGEYANAIAAYDLALGRATDDAEKALLYANRSACQLGLDANAAAAADATKAVKLAPKHAKAWYRLATAELRQRRGAQALRAAKRASALEAGGATRQLLKKCEQLHKTQKPGLYGDKRPAPKKSATALEVERRDGKMALDRSIAARGRRRGRREHGGMMVFFAKLARSAADFREVVSSTTAAADAGAALPAVLKKAMDVLAGAKRQGEGAGETMDAETERALWPSVVCEAYSRARRARRRRARRRSVF